MPIHVQPPLNEIIVQEKLAQVLGMHAIRHPGLVFIPDHEICKLFPLAEQVALLHFSPDKVAGPQQGEGCSHLIAVEEA
jgi:hypothetical protein